VTSGLHLNRDPEGREVVLLPTRGEEDLLVGQGQQATLPPDGQFRFTDPPGIEVFRVLVSPAKLDWVNPRELFAMAEFEDMHRSIDSAGLIR